MLRSRYEKFPNKNKKMIIKGSGKFMAKIPGCLELITLGHLNNMRLDIQLDMIDIEGGDTATPIDTLLQKKVIDITAEDAKFDLNMVRLVLGSKLREGVSGLTYDMKVENLVADEESGTVVANVSQSISTAQGMPKVQVFNQTVGMFIDSTTFTASGNKISFTSGVTDRDELVVYFPVSSSQIDQDGFVWVLEEKHSLNTGGAAAAHLNYPLFESAVNGTMSKIEHVSARLIHENKLLMKTSNPNPGQGEFYVDVNENKLVFNEYLRGEGVYVNYKRPEVVDVLDIGSNDFPLTVHIVHDGLFEQKDGSLQGYQTELFSCRVKSNFTIDAARQQASTHSVTLTVIDPERPDGRLGTIKRYQVAGGKGLEC
ncbi:hypothetical protein [Bacillus horti]|uniref:Uncharacterized protein n=1 Tax=Caldalkalibacillus horti TaxID=77523 RepID=A0ABT9W0N8_9BACI|nr:hypothetical protein [Bacillus horti]MDQ0166607.1 hypothetical protein [Bacillus horti]